MKIKSAPVEILKQVPENTNFYDPNKDPRRQARQQKPQFICKRGIQEISKEFKIIMPKSYEGDSDQTSDATSVKSVEPKIRHKSKSQHQGGKEKISEIKSIAMQEALDVPIGRMSIKLANS
jgi:hypothetical protein